MRAVKCKPLIACLVASSSEKLASDQGDLWDSGKVELRPNAVRSLYEGAPLAVAATVFLEGPSVWSDGSRNGASQHRGRWACWTIRIGRPTTSAIATMPPIHTDTKRLFLPAARQYRKEFAAKKQIKQATLYATALGIYELHLNGKRVGDAMFAPGWTDYRQRAYYNTYDVTDMVRPGDNAVGAWVADGWYSGYVGFGLLTGMGTEKNGRYTYGKTPSVMAQLEIEYTDGTRETIGTDRTLEGHRRRADPRGRHVDGRSL